jgi:glycosyltransferase involved in cell wall biosynthesis
MEEYRVVSIIIPVYNVEKYIDRCLDSVVNQTYKDIEILIMEAKSTDHSLYKCIEWAKNDDRITIVSRRDGGLGPGRNYGLNIAKGEYVVFVDSDDWISYDFVEKTIEVAQKDEQIDIVQADVITYVGDVEKNAKRTRPDFVVSTVEEKKEHMWFGDDSTWGKLYRTELFKKNKIEQPQLPCEDLAVYPALVACSRKIATCYKATAYYQAERDGSLYQQSNGYLKFPLVMEYAKKQLERLGWYETYRDTFQCMMYRHFCMTTAHYIGKEHYRNLKGYSPEMARFGETEFARFWNGNYMVMGGFTLRWICHKLADGQNKLKNHKVFSSVIAQMTDGKKREFCCENELRRCALQEDFAGWQIDEQAVPDLILIDFMQECTDILVLNDGNMVTKSEALMEYGLEKLEDVSRCIQWNTEEFWDLWKQKCRELIELLKKHYQTSKIVVVRNYLAEEYRENKKIMVYENIDVIRQKNNIIKEMYDFFDENMGKYQAIEYKGNMRYTDVSNQNYEPAEYYLNPVYYDEVAKTISMAIYPLI